ncbi:MAG: QueT transporter family protein [Firmicutes bacterium]|nr:QueT transporter family protein [Bacillota bacterium]
MLTKHLVRGGVIAALYVILTVPLASLAFGPIQIRPAEALTVLPILFPEAIPGVFIGCLLANTISMFGWIDIVFGSSITLLAAIVTRLTRKTVFAFLSPVIFNAVLISTYVAWFITDEWFSTTYWVAYGQTAVSIAISQAIVVFGLGVPLIAWLRKVYLHEY